MREVANIWVFWVSCDLGFLNVNEQYKTALFFKASSTSRNDKNCKSLHNRLNCIELSAFTWSKFHWYSIANNITSSNTAGSHKLILSKNKERFYNRMIFNAPYLQKENGESRFFFFFYLFNKNWFLP